MPDEYEPATIGESDGHLPDRIAQRFFLHAAGASDAEIARMQGLDSRTIYAWRRRQNLKPNPPSVGDIAKLKADARQALLDTRTSPERLALYQAGLSDPEIACREGVRTKSIEKWRKVRGLTSNFPPARTTRADPSLAFVTPDLKRRCLALLERGIGARVIAREMAASLKTIESWRTIMIRERPELRRPSTAPRKLRSHPSGKKYSKMRQDRRARAFVLYADGWNDQQIAHDLGLYTQQIWKWRNALFLPPVEKPQRKHAAKRRPKPSAPAITPMANPLYAHIFQSVGQSIAPDLRDDVVSEMWLAVAEGRLSPDQIPRQAARFRNQTMANYASRFGLRSLDEEIGDGDGYRMIDMLKDEGSSDWLERNGATVW